MGRTNKLMWPTLENDALMPDTEAMHLDNLLVTKSNFPIMSESELKWIVASRHPHIGKQIDLLWGYPEMNTKFNEWAIDTRGNRIGFDPIVLDALVQLSAMHNEQFNFDKKKNGFQFVDTFWPTDYDALL